MALPRPRAISRRSPALLVLLAVALHAPTLGHRFLLDDGVQIYKNPAVTAGAPLGAYSLDRDTTSSRPDYNTRIYRPLRNLAFRAVVRIGGVRPLAFGVANLVLYALATLLLFHLLQRLVGDPTAAAWATAVWLAAPVHVEPVAYASALGDLLSLALELGAIVVAVPLFDDERPRWGRLAASAALALAAMLAKEMAVTEPALLLLVAALSPARRWRGPSLRWTVALHALVALGYVVLRTHVVGAVGQDPLTLATLRDGVREAPWLLAHYLALTIEPLGHAASYRVRPPGALALALTLAGIVAVAGWAWAWRRQRPAFAVGLAWFAVALLPVLHLVPLWADLADRFALFPSVGLALALAATLAPPDRWVKRRVVTVALAAWAAVYAVATVVEARPWRSDSLLWRYAVDRQPEAPLARSNLAAVLLAEGRLEEAAAQLEALHALGYTRADFELKRGYVLMRLGRSDEAARALTAASRLDPASGVASALAGQLALGAGDAAGAAGALIEARRLTPAHPSTGLLGYLLLRTRGDAGIAAADARVDYLRALQALAFDDAAEAARAARDCLGRSPGRPQCESALGQALVRGGPLSDEARTLLERARASLPEGVDRQRCQEALWSAR